VGSPDRVAGEAAAGNGGREAPRPPPTPRTPARARRGAGGTSEDDEMTGGEGHGGGLAAHHHPDRDPGRIADPIVEGRQIAALRPDGGTRPVVGGVDEEQQLVLARGEGLARG